MGESAIVFLHYRKIGGERTISIVFERVTFGFPSFTQLANVFYIVLGLIKIGIIIKIQKTFAVLKIHPLFFGDPSNFALKIFPMCYHLSTLLLHTHM